MAVYRMGYKLEKVEYKPPPERPNQFSFLELTFLKLTFGEPVEDADLLIEDYLVALVEDYKSAHRRIIGGDIFIDIGRVRDSEYKLRLVYNPRRRQLSLMSEDPTYNKKLEELAQISEQDLVQNKNQ
ncbi:MAG: hypothetical protein HYT70_02265 [Candidatus Aenigmarchaeota archaeon]|nr:hypothetical protein [Candidatus Aenigmarchaeota archaeon]